MNNWLKKAAPVALASTLLAGCSFGSGDDKASDVETTVKVMYYDESGFYQNYGMLYSALNPNVNFEIVSTQSLYNNSGPSEDGEEFDYDKALQKLLDEEKPDILMLDQNQYEKLAQDGKLLDIEAYMAKDKFDTEGLVPGMADYMKELGGGQLYGFPSSFSSQVLYYNKALFDKYNIAYPTDQMSWHEVIQLARQFPIEGEPEERVYGLKVGYSGDLNEMANMLASADNLKYVDTASKTMTINSDGWKNVLQTSLDALNSKALYFESMDQGMNGGSGSYEDYLMRNPFLSGRLAMTVDSTYLMQQIEEAGNYIKEEGAIISDWDMVTMPVSAQYPDQSSSTWYSDIFAIAKDSPSADAAWDFISYISSDDYSRVKSKVTNMGGFPIRTAYIKDEEGRNFAAFYKLKPTRAQQDYREYEKLNPQFNMMFYNHMNEEFKAVQDGTKTIDEALELLQVKGEELLSQEPMTEEEVNKEMEKRMAEEQAKMQEAAGEAVSETVAE
ncbi:extracellular solute-binding protein [Paenibacillus sp. LHD-117]|uniref:ABC transporter substrate-binding protein n=1 Tax=Paenibacillus sp. LHD-117 TaxID=3071412 RepID=UPI0027DEBDE9|nr:extracellular solute-binding protein [Paenibacillus sp. LHD-117]MDQ6420044.1 extracellular solute-binding protein [Paenibacillus sp. LHD-117]